MTKTGKFHQPRVHVWETKVQVRPPKCTRLHPIQRVQTTPSLRFVSTSNGSDPHAILQQKPLLALPTSAPKDIIAFLLTNHHRLISELCLFFVSLDHTIGYNHPNHPFGNEQDPTTSKQRCVCFTIQLFHQSAAMSADSNDLLEAFKAAALSVTKLYKTTGPAVAKARTEGYQDCLDDLLAFLDRRRLGLSDGEGWIIRSWATERLDGRDLPTVESDDDDKIEPALSPQAQSLDPIQEEDSMRDSPPAPAVFGNPQEEQQQPQQEYEQPQQEHQQQQQRQPPSNPDDFQIVVPTQETFTFQSAHPFPHEEAMKLENLALSDAPRNRSVSTSTSSRNNRNRALRQSATRTLGRGAGQKRKVVDLAEFFRIDNFGPGNDKDPFNQNSKRSRHT
ncbi:hypothetical protein NEUTE1DRAFT_132098 [Neurospora tetrasperma FGSC 2508]|uniref:Uncharacterized protein n=1 Tax=Neurospora tetrasperma (strain FGSC 2508 / ATCC MYA-4615 / P0657) TaxID=510951 RepID=F8MUY8_NEUT8|nr:uncharacterized protein NEUTE1DRAFT_132098 [Neurospora tetrasperma FGSC 2508]EGO54613.1 hypothetical protein NEUTE1DRAFT_132098 [Neurospora tetrasperma FGSC 2508]EGZ67932.1 hypothetical protein NEUTE2DRAFT_95897 [Neurospora tetrasperma FGSC 2509]